MTTKLANGRLSSISADHRSPPPAQPIAQFSTFSLAAARSCPIHFGPLKPDAKRLPCGHSFCFDCLKPYASNQRVACPLCNKVHRVDIYLLPNRESPAGSLGSLLVEALPPSAEEYVVRTKAAETEKSLRDVESSCEMVLELLESIKSDVREVKLSFEQKRHSLADELRQYEDRYRSSPDPSSNDDAEEDEDDKANESRNLVSICDMFQRLCAMVQDRALHRILDVSKDVEDVTQRVKSIGLCRYFVDSEHEMDANLEREIIDCLSSIIRDSQRSSTSSIKATDEYRFLTDRFLDVFPPRLAAEGYRDGIWTSIVGDSSSDKLIWSIPSILSIQGRTSSIKMIVYFTPTNQSTHKLGMRITQMRFKTIVDEETKSITDRTRSIADQSIKHGGRQDESINPNRPIKPIERSISRSADAIDQRESMVDKIDRRENSIGRIKSIDILGKSIDGSEDQASHHSDQSIDNKQRSIDRISAKIRDEFGGKWHCVLGNANDGYTIKSTGDRNFLLRAQFDKESELICWKY